MLYWSCLKGVDVEEEKEEGWSLEKGWMEVRIRSSSVIVIAVVGDVGEGWRVCCCVDVFSPRLSSSISVRGGR